MKKIILTRGFAAVVDAEDFEQLSQFKWYAQSRRGYFYAARWDNSVRPRKIISMHREIVRATPADLVDHIDGDQMNNTRQNLRIVCKSQNNQNSRKRPGKSRYRGVRELERKTKPSKWRAVLNCGGVRIDGGCFATEIEAARAYNALVISSGSIAPLNGGV